MISHTKKVLICEDLETVYMLPTPVTGDGPALVASASSSLLPDLSTADLQRQAPDKSALCEPATSYPTNTTNKEVQA